MGYNIYKAAYVAVLNTLLKQSLKCATLQVYSTINFVISPQLNSLQDVIDPQSKDHVE